MLCELLYHQNMTSQFRPPKMLKTWRLWVEVRFASSIGNFKLSLKLEVFVQGWRIFLTK